MDTLTEIQNWYYSQCNGAWEHSSGIRIQNIDNPGWQVQIDLSGTSLEKVAFSEVKYGIEKETDDWLICRRLGKDFEGYGGPSKLAEILETFLKWARENQTMAQTQGDSEVRPPNQ
ncbi:MAG TPA: immunity 53 family protein [Prosthecobacter sp.]